MKGLEGRGMADLAFLLPFPPLALGDEGGGWEEEEIETWEKEEASRREGAFGNAAGYKSISAPASELSARLSHQGEHTFKLRLAWQGTHRQGRKMCVAERRDVELIRHVVDIGVKGAHA